VRTTLAIALAALLLARPVGAQQTYRDTSRDELERGRDFIDRKREQHEREFQHGMERAQRERLYDMRRDATREDRTREDLRGHERPPGWR
jgi:hypothetical protein